MSEKDMTVPTAADIATMTPMMRQYWELKSRCGDAILFFRMGDFYEIFGGDATLVAPLLELVLTSRERGDDQKIPFCGVPHHSAKNYWLRLLKRGFKVALADQVEDPATAKGLVKRDIIKIMTPGCIDDPEALDRDAPNYVAAVHEEPGSGCWTFALADLSTGELRLGNLKDHSEIYSAVEKFRPRELLARRFFHSEFEQLMRPYRDTSPLLIEPLPEATLRDHAAQKAILNEIFGMPELCAQPSGSVIGGDALVAALLSHFRSLQTGISQFLSVRPLSEAHTIALDETVVRDLELFETARRRDSEGSLFKEINHTLSPMGARLLRYFLANPLLDPKQIRGRHEAVRCLTELGEQRLAEARTHLKLVGDLERLTTRILGAAASPLDLLRVQQTLTTAMWLVDALITKDQKTLSSPLYQSLAMALKMSRPVLEVLGASLNDEPKTLGLGNSVFRLGYDPELDQLNELAKSGEAQVDAYQEKLRASTGIGSLKIKNHKSYGLLIEVTRTHTAKVPENFIRRQTMVNCDRFVTVELEELGETLLSASDRAVHREAQLFQDLLSRLSSFKNELRSTGQALGTIDLLQSFAWLALRQNYVEPTIVPEGGLHIRGCRHPVVERYVGRHAYTPNDIEISQEQRQILITGPNMAGKSTVMRQIAITAILNQIGSFVPALEARLPIFDRIFTRVGASDDLARGQSTFMVEMSESAHILRHASRNSLVILDEVGRGTSTRDGLALAAAILKDLALRVKCFALFATHYHELVRVATALPSVRPMQIEVVEQNETILFTHRLKDGSVDNSYGLEVARLAGVPKHVLVQASEFLEIEAERPKHEPPTTKSDRMIQGATAKGESPPLETMGLDLHGAKTDDSETQAAQSRLCTRLRSLNLNRLTPLQALNILAELQDLALPRATRTLFEADLG
ncbi:MAG: DNA mismatch repair protein MutS [Deltaproteobacteria bacterium]|nr:DNA mismatch repair protein MutS [Deltaproteobacteria bacterium]